MVESGIILGSVESSRDGITKEDGEDFVVAEIIFRLVEGWSVLVEHP